MLQINGLCVTVRWEGAMFRGSPGYLGGSPRIEPIDDWAMRHSSPSQKLNAGGRLIINHRQAIMFL